MGCVRRLPHDGRQRGQVLPAVREAAEMEMSNIRRCTWLIIKRGPEYLVGRILGTNDLKWSTSTWDAWRTRDRAEAEDVARAMEYLTEATFVTGEVLSVNGGYII